MKKLISYVGITFLSLIMSFGLFFNPVFATPMSTSKIDVSSNYSPNAQTKEVIKEVVFVGKVVPPLTRRYNQDNYTGTLNRVTYSYYSGINRTIAVYKGTVTCQGLCPYSDPFIQR